MIADYLIEVKHRKAADKPKTQTSDEESNDKKIEESVNKKKWLGNTFKASRKSIAILE